jgi:large subunit ribosomal protein L27
MAHKKAGGSTSLGRDSVSKRLGVKMFAGQIAKPGNVLVRQRGTKIRPGKNVIRGGDDTLVATSAGIISFQTKKIMRFNGQKKLTKYIHVTQK